MDLKAVQSICKPITEGTDFEKASKFKYLFADVDIAEDISLGLRGYNRNIDRLSNQLIVWYNRTYPPTAELSLSRREGFE